MPTVAQITRAKYSPQCSVKSQVVESATTNIIRTISKRSSRSVSRPVERVPKNRLNEGRTPSWRIWGPAIANNAASPPTSDSPPRNVRRVADVARRRNVKSTVRTSSPHVARRMWGAR